MDGTSVFRRILIELRKEAGLSQGDVAERLGSSPSRISRLESGDLQINHDEAREIAAAIGQTSDKAKLFARYLSQRWEVIERPGFNHPSLLPIWRAEVALQELGPLLD